MDKLSEARNSQKDGEQGFMLLGLIVVIFLILLVLSEAAPQVAHELQREREVETMHRGNQYVRAIQLYYRKFGHYPASIDQLENSNNIRFLRKRFIDPLTGKDDWRLIRMGEAKTIIKGFFGRPLAGVAPGLSSSGLFGQPSVEIMPSLGATSTVQGQSSIGPPINGPGSTEAGSDSLGLGTAGTTIANNTATAGGNTDSPRLGSTDGIGSQSVTGLTEGGTPFVGVGVVKAGNSILTLNEQKTYQTWEFIYDARIEQLRAKGSLFGGAPTSANTAGLGLASDEVGLSPSRLGAR